MNRNDLPTHRAPYYGGEKFPRTLQQAFGPYADWYPTTRRSRLRRAAPWILLVAGVLAMAVSFLDTAGVFA